MSVHPRVMLVSEPEVQSLVHWSPFYRPSRQATSYLPTHSLHVTHTGDRVLFSGDFFLSLFLCQQHYEKTAGPICKKYSWKVWSDHGLIKFWVNSGKRVGGSKVNFLLSLAVAQRTGVNKSVSFARWQQGAEFVVPRTTACLKM